MTLQEAVDYGISHGHKILLKSRKLSDLLFYINKSAETGYYIAKKRSKSTEEILYFTKSRGKIYSTRHSVSVLELS